MAAERYVWIWVPGQQQPTLCGHLRWDDRAASFAYVRSYRARADAIAINPAWPLNSEHGERWFPAEDDGLPGVIADVAPGRWAEYVLEKLNGRRLTPFDSLLAGNHDRTGALEFSERHDAPPATTDSTASLEDLAEAVNQLDRGMPIDQELLLLFRHGPSLGGRRPKATIMREGKSWIAKFVSVRDIDNLQPRREAFGLGLARAAGISVPDFKIIEVHGKPILLVERFDRQHAGERRHLVSARTLQNLSERQLLSSASYLEIAAILRQWSDSADTAAQWFDRMVFNIVLGNTDDHALNHLFGWNGHQLTLMPAFDLEQQPDSGGMRSQEMIVGLEGKQSTFANALSGVAEFGLQPAAAQKRIRQMVDRCQQSYRDVLQQSGLDGATAKEMQGILMLDFLNS